MTDHMKLVEDWYARVTSPDSDWGARITPSEVQEFSEQISPLEVQNFPNAPYDWTPGQGREDVFFLRKPESDGPCELGRVAVPHSVFYDSARELAAQRAPLVSLTDAQIQAMTGNVEPGIILSSPPVIVFKDEDGMQVNIRTGDGKSYNVEAFHNDKIRKLDEKSIEKLFRRVQEIISRPEYENLKLDQLPEEFQLIFSENAPLHANGIRVTQFHFVTPWEADRFNNVVRAYHGPVGGRRGDFVGVRAQGPYVLEKAAQDYPKLLALEAQNNYPGPLPSDKLLTCGALIGKSSHDVFQELGEAQSQHYRKLRDAEQ